MFSLFIDTTQSTCYLAILRDDKIIGKFQTPTHNNLTDIAVEHIDALLKKHKVNRNDIKKIYVINGPGSFTGVRVSTLIAKTFAIVNNAILYSLDALTFQLPLPSGISLLDARGGHQYVMVKKDRKILVKPQMLKAIDI
ncbi:MAG: tRNA (adenosine(37)-N6)-threonylcarbamoyltransferase complex dimerization subunit type 1 TsaB, partial [Mycoplasmataceae bacterium]|nr:tRNA (adenosine(37)-N6)-threonylcarbamoyltransferase complex dimerization subunit type 1 TsaB [Mycoplasmataceae bacterium]